MPACVRACVPAFGRAGARARWRAASPGRFFPCFFVAFLLGVSCAPPLGEGLGRGFLSLQEVFMRGGIRIPRKRSQKIFRRGAQRVHPKNSSSRIMRGGIRL